MHRSLVAPLIAIAVCTAIAPEVDASTEPPALYDARSVGMGGTGGAFLENGAAIYHNAAALDGVEHGVLTVVLSPIFTRLHSPVAGPDTDVKSDTSAFPLFLIGGAYRVHERVVVGVAAYPTAGFGSGYSNVPALGGQDLRFSIVAMEASPAASFRITDTLSLGLAWRFTYVHQNAHSPLGPPTGGSADQTLNGVSLLGAQIAAYFRPSHDLHFALTYRSKVVAKLSGKTTLNGNDLDTSGKFAAAPHTFKLAVAGWLVRHKLLLALDLKYLLFKEANKELVLTTETPLGPQTSTLPLGWKNVLSANCGAELMLDERFAIRAGYTVSQSATPADNAAYFTPPPGLLQAVHLGAGVHLPSWDLDVGGHYAFGSAHGESPDPRTNPGQYRFVSALASVSMTHRF